MSPIKSPSFKQCHHYPEVGSPIFWLMGIAASLEENALEIGSKNLKFLDEVVKTQVLKKAPQWASHNKVVYTIRTYTLRNFSDSVEKDQTPVLILPPYAGHTSMIADFHKKQSLVETLMNNGVRNVYLTEWHSASDDMKDFDIDTYLADLNVAVDDLGVKVHLIGLCQGGWMASLYAARFPHKIKTLVLAGSPIDTQAGQGAIKDYVKTLPDSFYQDIVTAGNGILKGSLMLEGFKSLHPYKQMVEKYVELYEHIEDGDYLRRVENFERWFEYAIDLPGRWYLQVVQQLFKENRFVKKKFKGLGQILNPKSITCPLYLLAGEKDEITPKEQVFEAANIFGVAKERIQMKLAAGGHIGLFMGSKALENDWPDIARWIVRHDKAGE